MKKKLLAGLILCTGIGESANAQSYPSYLENYINNSGLPQVVSPSFPLPVTGTISVSLAGFTPNGVSGSLSATTTAQSQSPGMLVLRGSFGARAARSLRGSTRRY